MAIQVLGKGSHPTAGLSHHGAMRSEEFGQSVQPTDLRLQAGLLPDGRFPPVLSILNLKYFLQHPFSLADPFREDCHSGLEVSSIWSLYRLKL